MSARFATLALVVILAVTTAYAQTEPKVSLKFKHVLLSKVLKSIKSQTGYVFVTGIVDVNNLYVDADFTNADVRTVLSGCLPNLNLQYFIYDKTIVITRGTTDPARLGNATELSGTVVGSDGEILAGASVTVNGLQLGTLTNNRGYFNLAGVPDNSIVRISFVGYVTEDIAVSPTRALGTITLKVNNNKLDEVQILGYGQTASQRYSTGSSVKVTSEDIAKQPVGNVLQALEGRVAGLNIRQTSGLPGADIDVSIRGQNSIDPKAGIPNSTNVIKNLPLFIVDGVPFPAAAINVQSSNADNYGNYNYLTGPNGNGSPLATLNPGDIESIEILKDASATGIYGSRGANGVILITTKKGKAGKVHLSAGANTGYSIIPSSLPVLGLSDYLSLRREAFANDGRTPSSNNAPDLTLWSQTTATDFKKMLLGKPARNVGTSVSVTGGSGGTTFLISGNYSRQSSIFDDGRSSSTYGLHFGLNYASDDQKFKTSVSALLGNNTSNLANVNFYQTVFTLPPNFPLYDANNKLYWWDGIPGIANPLSLLNLSYRNSMTNMSTSINMQYTILPGLDAQVNFGFNKTQSNQNSLQPSTSFDPSFLAFSQPSATYGQSYNQNLLVEPQLNYRKEVGRATLTAFVGGTLQKTVYEQPFLIRAAGLPSDLFLNNLSLASSYRIYNGYNAYNYASVLGRANYIWDKRFVFDVNFRRDGSSKFGPNNLYGNFGSVSGAWIFTNESWLKNKIRWFSFGKLRTSYGSVGSDGVQNYAFLSTYAYNTQSYYSGSNCLVPARLANSDFKWETTKKFEAAIDLGFFQDKLLVNVAHYRNITSNQLLQYPLPTQTGFQNYVQNFNAEVENSGWEFTLTSANIKTKSFSWNTAFNAGFAKNKLLAFPGLANSPFAYSYVIGKPLSALYLLHYTGIGTDGNPTYTDVDKDAQVTTLQGYNTGYGDMLYAGKTTPALTGGIGNTFRCKGLQLDVFFQFTAGAVDQGILAYTLAPPGGLTNVPQAVVSQLRALSLSKMITTSSYSPDFYNLKQSDALLSKISYGRLTNLSLSYNLPAGLSHHIGASGVSFNIRAQNLFVFTLNGRSYPGIDPETGPASVPPLRAIIAGLQFTF